MSELCGHFIGVMIVVIMLVFIGIWIWAWLPHHKNEFDELARLPLDEDEAMSGFWSVWVMVLACVTAAVSLFLFVWGIRMRIPTDARRHHRSRVGARRAARRRCVRCHCGGSLISVGTFLFAVGYLVLYPGFGSFGGKLGWTSQGQHATQCRRQRCKARSAAWRPCARSTSNSWRRTRTRSPSVIASISTTAPPATAATALGNHAVGAPDLTDADWLYGGDGEAILTSILDGRNGVMPPLGAALGHNGANAVASYVVSQSGTQAPPDQVAAGKAHFDALCAACHGADGRGNPALGAPNLFDKRLALRRQHRKRRGQRAQGAQRRDAGLAPAPHRRRGAADHRVGDRAGRARARRAQ